MGAENKNLSWSLGRFLPVLSVHGALEGRVAALEAYLVRLSEALEEVALLQGQRAEAEAQAGMTPATATQAQTAEVYTDSVATVTQAREEETHGNDSYIGL